MNQRSLAEIRAFYTAQAQRYRPDGVVADVLYLLRVIDGLHAELGCLEAAKRDLALENVRLLNHKGAPAAATPLRNYPSKRRSNHGPTE